MDEQGKDQGVNIRHKVKEMVDFIQDDDKLREERKKAKKNKDKYVGMSNDTLGMGMGYRGGGGGGGGASGGSEFSSVCVKLNFRSCQQRLILKVGKKLHAAEMMNSVIGILIAETVLQEGKMTMTIRLISGIIYITFQSNKNLSFNAHFSADEATDRRDISSGIESKPSGRFGGEFRDSEEPIKRQDKEFKFDIDKSKSTSAKSTKKIDLGAAAFYKVEPTPATAPV